MLEENKTTGSEYNTNIQEYLQKNQIETIETLDNVPSGIINTDHDSMITYELFAVASYSKIQHGITKNFKSNYELRGFTNVTAKIRYYCLAHESLVVEIEFYGPVYGQKPIKIQRDTCSTGTDFGSKENCTYTTRREELELIVTNLLNEYERGYTFIKNCTDLVEKLTEFKASDKIKVKLTLGVNDVNRDWHTPVIYKDP